MIGHTKEPWEVLPGVEDGAILIVGSNLGGLVAAAHSWPTEIDSGDTGRIEANARRIVDCVNAMAGKDPAAYVAAFEGMVEALDGALRRCSMSNITAEEIEAALTAARLARGGE